VALVWPVAPGVVPVAAGVVPVELAALVVAPVPGVVATMVEGTAVEFKQLVLPELHMRKLIYQIKHYIPPD
jgi:hypothetical protein